MNDTLNSARLVNKDICRRFERAALHFDQADFVHANTREGLLKRIQPLLIEAKTVVDLGSATSSAERALARRFKRAQVVSIDLAQAMLKEGRRKSSWFSKSAYVRADAAALPFAPQSIDVVFSNLLLPWIHDPTRMFSEVARVLRKGGVFAFATLGPDSLQQLHRAWRQIDDSAHVNRFLDMHDLGDGLVRAGLSDPVLDVDRLTISYTDSRQLLDDLTASGSRNTLAMRRPSLTGQRRFATMLAALDDARIDGKITLDLELVYGHCWGAGAILDRGDYRVDASAIPRRRG